MKPIRFSDHALENMAVRKIDAAEVERTIRAPEQRVPGDPPPREIYMRRYHSPQLNKGVLLRVVVEETITEIVVVTVYQVSRPARYLKEIGP